MSPIRVVLADDQPMVRAGFTALLNAQDDIEVIGEAVTGRQALTLIRSSVPDVTVMDIQMPELDGLEATRQITHDPALTETRVLVLTTFELDEYVFGALDAGASGFLLKGGEPSDLVRAVRTIAAGDSLLAPSVTRRLIDHYVASPQPSSRTKDPNLDELTDRELEVLRHVAAGLTNAEIANQLYLSPLTIKTHVSRILMKLNARDRVQLVVLAYRNGIAES